MTRSCAGPLGEFYGHSLSVELIYNDPFDKLIIKTTDLKEYSFNSNELMNLNDLIN